MDPERLRADTGGLDLSAANRLLPRPSRSICLPAYSHTPLNDPAVLLDVPLATLLPNGGGSCGEAAVGSATTRVTVSAPGAADALVV